MESCRSAVVQRTDPRASLDITEFFEIDVESGGDIPSDQVAMAGEAEGQTDSLKIDSKSVYNASVSSRPSPAEKAHSLFVSLVRRMSPWIPATFHPKKWDYDRGDRVVIDTLDLHPLGYPRLASYINSDPNFALYRRHGYLHNRVLLYRQDELGVLQDDLETMDDLDAEKDQEILRSRDHDEKKSTERKELIQTIDEKLKQYDDLLIREARLRSFPRPSNRNHSSLWNWQDNNHALITDEEHFIYHKNDFISLAGGKQNTTADDAFENLLDWLGFDLLHKAFSTPEQRVLSSDRRDHYYSKARVHYLTSTVGISLLLVIVIVPVLVLFDDNSSNTTKVAVVVTGTLIFPLTIEVFTQIERHQVFATTIAYAAVLVVFLGNLQSVTCMINSGSTAG